VGSDEGLTSSRPRVEEQVEAELNPEPGDGSTAEDSVKVSGEGVAATRHTGKKKVDQTKDDTDVGWGERGDDDPSGRWLRENRPPHWD